MSELSNKYYIEITPAGWTFSIWGFIYTYQVSGSNAWFNFLEFTFRNNFFVSQKRSISYLTDEIINIVLLESYKMIEIVI